MNVDGALRRLGMILLSFGIDPRRFWAATRSIPYYVGAYRAARRAVTAEWPLHLAPALGDRGETAGSARGHYFFMDLWAARKVFQGNFQCVVDIGSRVDGYVAHILSFREIEIVDVRPLHSEVRGLTFRQADLMSPSDLPTNHADCVTSLHALEHFGLGRYGDPVDLDGWSKGFSGLVKMLKPGGTLLLAVPVGRQRVEFDSHRIFSPQTIIDMADRNNLELRSFALVCDDGSFIEEAKPADCGRLRYGCGCFEFAKADGSAS